jgi:hypothetical protein
VRATKASHPQDSQEVSGHIMHAPPSWLVTR